MPDPVGATLDEADVVAVHIGKLGQRLLAEAKAEAVPADGAADVQGEGDHPEDTGGCPTRGLHYNTVHPLYNTSGVGMASPPRVA